jgi:tetratricopeptide (TPR) repeat protein
MEDITNDSGVTEKQENNKCVNCGSSWIEQGHLTPLCSECRQSFIKFPIPPVIKIFSLVIIAIVLIAMIRLPNNISLGVHEARGEKALKNKQYLTAQREFKNVLKETPHYLDAKVNSALSSFYIQDYSSMLKDLNDLEGMEIEGQGLYADLLKATNELSNYFPSDSFLAMQKNYADSSGNIPINEIQKFAIANPDDIYASIALASSLFDKKEYLKTDTILSNVLKKMPDHLTALALMTTLKREIKKFDESILYCNNLLSINRESIYGMSSKARTYLKMKKDQEALKLASQARDISNDDPYNLATLALVYHFNNMIKQRDEILAKAMKDSLTQIYFEFANDVISNKVKFR